MGLNLPENAASSQQISILDALPALIFLEQGGKIVFANASARAQIGCAEKWIPCASEDVLWGLFPGPAEPNSQQMDTAGDRPFRATLASRSGTLLPVEGTYHMLEASSRTAVIVAQLTGRERLGQAHRLEEVLACIPEAVAIVDQNHILYINPAFTRIFGYEAAEVVGGDLSRFILPETRRQESDVLEWELAKSGNALVETVRQNKKGELVDVAVAAAPLMVNGAQVGAILTYRDIAARKQVEAKLQHDAMHDGLTGLPNRALFLDRLKLALNRRSRRRDLSCGVFFVDLDRFKEINDTLGHAAGDVVLMTVAERLRGALRPQDTAARFGGDEFAVLVENIVSVEDLDIVANRILQEMMRPFEVFSHKVQGGASIGVALAGPDHVAPELIIRDADYAMYRAKQDGGGRYEIFDKSLRLQVSHQQERERELRQALDARAFEVWYEPIFRLQGGKLEGFESQLRWRHQDGTVGSFDELIAVAEDTGLSISIGRETIENVCRRLRGWTQAMPQSDQSLTINLTPRQFFHPDFLAQLKRTLAVTRVNPGQIMFEVAETTLNVNPDAAVVILQRMVDCGVRLAMDDFGASLAPLSYLVQMPIDVLKLHPRLATSAITGGRQYAIVDTLIRLGLKLGVQIVAQGIESLEQFEALSRMGCELGQGPIFSPALEGSQAQKMATRGVWEKRPGTLA